MKTITIIDPKLRNKIKKEVMKEYQRIQQIVKWTLKRKQMPK